MRSNVPRSTLFLVLGSLLLFAPSVHAVGVSDGHATNGTLVTSLPVSFQGDVLAYAEDSGLLVLGTPDAGGEGSWSLDEGDVRLVPLSGGDVPFVQAGVHAEVEAGVSLDETERLGLPPIQFSARRETEIRATLDARSTVQAALDALEPEPEPMSPEEIASLADGDVLAVYLLEGVLQVQGGEAVGLVLREAVAVEATEAAAAAGFPLAVNPGAYALTMPAAEWTVRGSALALVRDDDGDVFAVRITDGAMRGASASPVFGYAERFRGALDGRATFDGATGDLEVGPDLHALVGQLVRLTGTYGFEATAAEGAEPGDGRAAYALQGRTTALALPLDDAAAVPSAVFIIPAALAALGALVYFAEVVKFAAFAPAMGLFSRIADSELLANEVRDRIHRLVSENPGITIKECQALAAIGWGTTVYHLRRLEDSRMVTSIRDGNFRRFYKNGAAPGTAQKAALGEMRRQPSVRIAQFVIANPGACQKDLCEALEMSPPLAHKYMRRMLNANLVTTQREWKKVKYYPTESLHKAANGWTEGPGGAAPATVASAVAAAVLPGGIPASGSAGPVPSA